MLACCSNYVLAPLGRYLSCVLTLFTPILKRIWEDVFKGKLPPGHATPTFPILNQSTDVTAMVRALNRSIPERQQRDKVSWAAYDVEKMYTNIDSLGLKTACGGLRKEVFKYLADHPKDGKQLEYILVTLLKGESRFAHERPCDRDAAGGVEQNRHTGKLGNSEFDFCIDEEILGRWTDIIVDNIYISIGTDIVLKQVIGIPIGIQPGVFFANFYMFYYELDFARRAVALRKFDIIAHFRVTGRFVDDIIAIRNALLKHLLYLHDTYDGLGGIYPICITITKEQYSFTVLNYLDITIFKYNGIWHTKIYNKKHHAPLNKIKHITYQHIDTFTSRACKYGVVTSQITRFHRLCSLKSDFIYTTTQFIVVLAQKRYSLKLLTRALTRYVKRHCYLYGTKSPKHLVIDIIDSVRAQVPGAL